MGSANSAAAPLILLKASLAIELELNVDAVRLHEGLDPLPDAAQAKRAPRSRPATCTRSTMTASASWSAASPAQKPGSGLPTGSAGC
jgi:hypothetical protein